MEMFTAHEAEQNFGELIDKALQTPVSATKQGYPSIVVTSDSECKELLKIKHEHLREGVQKGFDEIDRNEVSKRKNDEIASAVLQRHKQG